MMMMEFLDVMMVHVWNFLKMKFVMILHVADVDDVSVDCWVYAVVESFAKPNPNTCNSNIC